MRPLAVLALLALTACGSKTELPPLPPPGPDMCVSYSSFRYGAAAAQVEEIASLRAHNANEATYYDRCVTNSPNLPADRPKGPR